MELNRLIVLGDLPEGSPFVPGSAAVRLRVNEIVYDLASRIVARLMEMTREAFLEVKRIDGGVIAEADLRNTERACVEILEEDGRELLHEALARCVGYQKTEDSALLLFVGDEYDVSLEVSYSTERTGVVISAMATAR